MIMHAVSPNPSMSFPSRVLSVAATTALLLLAGCETAPRVRTDQLATAGLERCQTFSFEGQDVRVSDSDRAFANPVNERRLRDAVAAELSKRGMRAVEGGTAECLVSVSLGSRQNVENDPMPIRWGVGFGWGHPGFMGSVGWNDSVYAYREGRITVDIFSANHDPLWHAYAETDASGLTGPRAEARIKRAVSAIFAQYPATTG